MTYVNSNHVKFPDFEKKNTNSTGQETYLVGGFKHNKKRTVMRCKL